MMSRYLSAVPLLALFIVGCGADQPITSKPKVPESTQKPTKVEVFRVKSEDNAKPGEKAIAGFPIISQGTDQSAAFGERINAIVFSDKVTPNQKKCGFEPGIAFRVWYGGKANDILICFRCDVLWSKPKDVDPKFPAHDWKDFDSIRPELLKLAKEAFPADKEIQGLADKR